MGRLEGYISKKNVLRWLEFYESLEAGDPIDDGVVVNTGPKADDGVSGARLNKIMLDQAIQELKKESMLAYRCLLYRWVRPIRTKEALKILKVGAAVYYNRSSKAVDFIYHWVNGEELLALKAVEDGKAGHKALFNRIFDKI